MLYPDSSKNGCDDGSEVLETVPHRRHAACEKEELTLGSSEVKNVAILLEHVDLLDTGDGLNLELLESSLELGVLTTGALGLRGHLTTGGTLTTCVAVIVASECDRFTCTKSAAT